MMMTALPALSGAANIATQLQDQRLPLETKFLNAVEENTKDIKSLLQTKPDPTANILCDRVKLWKAEVATREEAIATSSVEELKEITSNLKDKILDLKQIVKDWDTKSDELVNHNGHSQCMANLKTLQGAGGGGLKRFDKVITILRNLDVKQAVGADLLEFREDVIKIRQDARLQVAARLAVGPNFQKERIGVCVPGFHLHRNIFEVGCNLATAAPLRSLAHTGWLAQIVLRRRQYAGDV